ncbi:helix-turn-helix domain-containing protein [Paenisporosarcina quisquiliarum]|uniref:helix-turn-helix domain-containing protein n=1 Tax=Paenisporosarcina quisquiliarum TaxID=365346 RepID=UPI003736A4F2
MKIGVYFKKIRKNKGISQHYIAKDILSQSAYSKFELNKMDIMYSSYISLLEKLDISHEEFNYIKNGYQYIKKDELCNRFFKMTYNNPAKLNELILSIDTYLVDKEDILLRDIKSICEALLLLIEAKDMHIIRLKVENIWSRLSKYDGWYIKEIQLLNSILFLFPIDTALEITYHAIKNLKKYKEFQDTYKLEINIKLNMSLLLIKNEDYQDAINTLDSLINICKSNSSYKQLAAIRKGISLECLGLEGQEIIRKGKTILEAIEDQTLLDILMNEERLYVKNSNYDDGVGITKYKNSGRMK